MSVLLIVYATAHGQPGAGAPQSVDYTEAVALGSHLYALNCSVCHGKNGGGLEEARLSFPPGDRRCTRCHRPSNRVVQPLSEPLVDNNMFSIGTPPALHATPGGPQPLAGSASPTALWAYLSATMPRYDPGRQSPKEYWLLTAFLLDMNGRTVAAAEAVANATAASVP